MTNKKNCLSFRFKSDDQFYFWSLISVFISTFSQSVKETNNVNISLKKNNVISFHSMVAQLRGIFI